MTPRRWQRVIGSSWLGAAFLGGDRQRLYKLLKDVIEATGQEDVEVDYAYSWHFPAGVGEVQIAPAAADGHPAVSLDFRAARTDYDRNKTRDWVVPILRRWWWLRGAFNSDNYMSGKVPLDELASVGPLYLVIDGIGYDESGRIFVSLVLVKDIESTLRLGFLLYPRMPASELNEVRRAVRARIAERSEEYARQMREEM